MFKTRKTLISLVLIACFMLTVVLAGCGGQQAGQTGGKTLVFAQGSDPRGLDPALVDDGESANIMVNIYDNLVQYKPGSTEVEPGLATEWTSSPDGKEWTFKLRQGVKFHDGTPFNAEAVKYSIDRQLPPNRTDDMPYASFTFGPVKEVQVVDEYTVKIILNEPYAPFLANIAMCLAAPIVSKAAVEKYGADFNKHPVGTGPFKFVKWDIGQQIVLEANPDYWGGKPKLDKVVYKFVKENSVRASELMTGSVQVMTGVDPNDVKKLEEKGLTVSKNPGMNINYMGFYVDKEPFNNPKIRQALSMAINRENLVKFLYQGFAQLANGPLPSFMPGYDKTLQPYPYDPEGAKKLLAEAGAKDLSFEFITYSNTRPYNPVGGEKLAAAVQADLLKIGVKTTIKAYPWKEYKDALAKEEGDAFFYGWNGDNGDPDNFLGLLETKEIRSTLNSAHYSNPKVDELLVKGRQAQDPAERNKIYSEMQHIAVKDAPWVFISHGLSMAAYSPKVKGFELHPTGVCFLRNVDIE